MTLTKHRNGKQANVNMDTATLEKVVEHWVKSLLYSV